MSFFSLCSLQKKKKRKEKEESQGTEDPKKGVKQRTRQSEPILSFLSHSNDVMEE